MELTTLCYMEQDNKYLMLHRIKKKNDINHEKWIGVGGHFLEQESPDECLLREVKEETGFVLQSYRLRGIVTFVADSSPAEQMFLYTADRWEGDMKECDEGELVWVDKDCIDRLPIWEGDKVFFQLLNTRQDVFVLKLIYEGERLVQAVLDGRVISV